MYESKTNVSTGLWHQQFHWRTSWRWQCSTRRHRYVQIIIGLIPFFRFLLVYVTVWIYWQLTKKGKDASTDFDDVNHSNEAKETMKKYCIGDVDKSTVPVTAKYIPPWEKESTAETTKEETGNKMLVYLIPLLILGVAFFLRFYNNKLADKLKDWCWKETSIT